MPGASPALDGGGVQAKYSHHPGVQQEVEDPVSKNRTYPFSLGQQREQGNDWPLGKHMVLWG